MYEVALVMSNGDVIYCYLEAEEEVHAAQLVAEDEEFREAIEAGHSVIYSNFNKIS